MEPRFYYVSTDDPGTDPFDAWEDDYPYESVPPECEYIGTYVARDDRSDNLCGITLTEDDNYGH